MVTRTRTLTIDGAVLTIAPLTLEQVEKFIAPLEDLATNSQSLKVKSYDLILCGLNNAVRSNPQFQESDLWTHERITRELDWILYGRLQEEIMEFSGLKLVKASAPGSGSNASASEGRDHLGESKATPVH